MVAVDQCAKSGPCIRTGIMSPARNFNVDVMKAVAMVNQCQKYVTIHQPTFRSSQELRDFVSSRSFHFCSEFADTGISEPCY